MSTMSTMPKIQQIKTFDTFLKGSKKRVNVVYGGAGSGKSFAVKQHLLSKFLREKDKRILITRKTLPSLRITAWYEIVRSLLEWNIPVDINKSEFTIRFGDNEILAKSMDEPEKIKSAEFNYIWVEEATEINKEDFNQLDLRLRRESKDGKVNQIYLTFNPIDQFHWLIEDMVYGTGKEAYKKEDLAIHHSTYKDCRRFLSDEYCKRLEDFVNQDENFYRIYTLGEPGVLENVIYKNYKIDPFEAGEWNDVFYGLDFGYNNPSALVAIRLFDKNLHVKELLYQSNLTNAELIQKVKAFKIGDKPIYADSAEPQRIQEFQNAGFVIYPADKSVKDGIDAVKRHLLHIHPDSPNLIAEIRGYSYRKDKDGRVLEEPVKFKDHLCDAMRYAIHSWQKGQGTGERYKIMTGQRKW